MAKKNACDNEHNRHLCSLAKDKKFKKIQKLSIKPGFICSKCCRVADWDSSLCKPLPYC